MMSVVDPLTKVEAGLKGTGDKPIPLQAVDIKARLLDLAAQVTNSSPRFSWAYKMLSLSYEGGGGWGVVWQCFQTAWACHIFC